MKFFFLPFVLAFLTLSVLTQQPKTSTKKALSGKPASARSGSAIKRPAAKKDEKLELEKALALENPEQKAAALSKFLGDFPSSESRPQVLESLTAARVAAAQAKFEAGEKDAALKLVKKTLEEAPTPYSEKLFSESISRIPTLMFSLSGATAAYEAAAAIEKNVGANVQQFLSLAGFYLNLENGTEAKRLAEAAIKLDEKSAAAHQTLGMANRLNFDLESAATAYEKAVELDPESVAARQSLAEMKRATGKPEEAIAIFSALIDKDPNDLRSINGRTLSLFDAGKRSEAEAEFAKTIEAEPGNFVLLSGAAYWYAANGEHAKAVDLAGKAIAAEPRYIWSHIAMARGLAGEGRYTDAEQVLLKARKFGNFPTLDYELAAMKFSAGFYREAAEELQKSFSVKEGALVTKLGRRIERSEKDFIDLLAAERRASILQPKAADSLVSAIKMKTLLEFAGVVGEKNPDEAKAAELAGSFSDGTDKMRFHRQLFAASQLADRSLAPFKVLELTRGAVASADDGLSVPLAAAPILASELYASRTSAIASDKYVLVPEVSKQTLSAIARGRIEELSGAALMQQKNNNEAAIRLRRAVSILPEKSVWWRTSYWRLGAILDANGKDQEALDAYVKSYTAADPDAEKYAIIESVYKRVKNGTDGLDALIGANPAKPSEKKTENSDSAAETKTDAKTDEKTNSSGEIKPDQSQEKKADATDTKTPDKTVTAPQEKEVPKITESQASHTDTKQPAEEKAPEQKPAGKGEEPKPTENTPSQEENKKKPVEGPAVKPQEKVVEDISEPQPKPDRSAAELLRTKVSDPEANKSEIKAPDTKTEKPKTPETKPTPKPLFEPVIIEIKSSKPTKPLAASPDSAARLSENKDETSGTNRERVVTGKNVAVDLVPGCSLWVSQNNIALASGKGSIGVFVGTESGDIKDVQYSSSSPRDVDVSPDPALTAVNGQTLFVIRSLSEAVGVYRVEFVSPCGKKELQVRVR